MNRDPVQQAVQAEGEPLLPGLPGVRVDVLLEDLDEVLEPPAACSFVPAQGMPGWLQAVADWTR